MANRSQNLARSKQGMQNKSPIRVLHLEDNPLDVELIAELLREAGLKCTIESVRTRDAFQDRLKDEWVWDVILADFGLPGFDGLSALTIARELRPTTPFIFVTGTMGEDNAVESLKHGATDYVLKQNLARLAPAVNRALKERTETLRRLDAEAKLKESRDELQFLAYHDSLTGLPNRTFLLERLPDILANADRYKQKAAILFIDLDEFKVINDSLGHSVGDMVLKAVGERLKSTIRPGDVAARLGGDEFVLVLTSIKDTSDAAMAADRVNHVVATEISADDHPPLISSCSIGIGVFPDNGSDCESLLRNADAALYAAKENGRNTWRFFTNDLNRRAMERLTIDHALRHAMERNEFFLEYQPQVEIATGKLVGVEALLRWSNPDLGLVSPATFIPVAENTGEILSIGEWVLRTACRQAKEWEHDGTGCPLIAVNVSAVQFRHPSFLETVRAALADSGLEPQRLELEVTETQLIENAEKVGPLLNSLREMGVELAIDDFGVGYCGLSYVRAFPFSKLKIDQSFVRSIEAVPRDAALTRAVIDLATSLKMSVVAECVETENQVAILESLGCHDIQGYFYSRPVKADIFEQRFLQARDSCVFH